MNARAFGRTLVVTRLNPGGVCHVGYVDARDSAANEKARALASMIFSENRFPPRIKSGAGFFGIML